MRIAGTIPVSLVNGEGIRFVVFLQGCDHRCPGCQNPETWDFEGGHEADPEDIAYEYRKHAHLLDGITLSGGDPFYQQEECMKLLDLLPDVNVWIYTGFTYEEIADTELAKRADVIVDGPYMEELRTETLPYRGSTNQRIIRKR
ncbi:MAG: anaerobic ribonucleoside-triphosphate reductase activating protein [Bacteroidaceae bacterium]|nr:anaerobic ribonucleoside-triphosphate reductase activating protein [Bacteroidaceae bacterium]MBR4930429.1 anaerobic ribonucleoside-triphosphate reductase activating protein [Bacteroidaceae bacterium]